MIVAIVLPRLLRRGLVAVVLALILMCKRAPSQILPELRTRTVDNSSLKIPSALPRKPTVLLFGFSKVAAQEASGWDKHLLEWQSQSDNFSFYNVVMLAGAPRFTHSFIVRAIKASVPKPFHSHMLFASSGDAAYRQLLNVTDQEKAYVILCDSQGKIVWQTSGYREQDLVSLRTHLREELKNDEQ